MTLELVKIEEGLCGGEVLFHEYGESKIQFIFRATMDTNSFVIPTPIQFYHHDPFDTQVVMNTAYFYLSKLGLGQSTPSTIHLKIVSCSIFLCNKSSAWQTPRLWTKGSLQSNIRFRSSFRLKRNWSRLNQGRFTKCNL